MAVKRSRRRHCGPIQAAARKLKYANQQVRTARNRVIKLKKHLKRQPNDTQAIIALAK